MIIPSGDHSSAKPDGSFSKPCLVHHIRSHAVQKIQEKKKTTKKPTHTTLRCHKRKYSFLCCQWPQTLRLEVASYPAGTSRSWVLHPGIVHQRLKSKVDPSHFQSDNTGIIIL